MLHGVHHRQPSACGALGVALVGSIELATQNSTESWRRWPSVDGGPIRDSGGLIPPRQAEA
jgi:hypothetical protein